MVTLKETTDSVYKFNTESLDSGQCKVGELSWPLNS